MCVSIFHCFNDWRSPISVGTSKYPGFKIHDTRMIRLMEVMLHNVTVVSGWTARHIHEAILTTFGIGTNRYELNQLRYDLRKLKAHGLLARDGKRYAYRLTEKGPKVAPLFILFHKQLCGPQVSHYRRFHDDRFSIKVQRIANQFANGMFLCALLGCDLQRRWNQRNLQIHSSLRPLERHR